MIKIINISAKVVGFLGDIRTILAAVLSFFSMSLRKRTIRRRLRRVLSFKRQTKSCFVSVPKFKATILLKERNVAIYDEVALLLRVNSLLTSAGISIITETDEKDIVYDEIQIGGPVSNKFTNRYFKRYLKGITWAVTDNHLKRYRADKNLHDFDYDFIGEAEDKKEGFKIGERFFPYTPGKKGLAVIIKIIDKYGAIPRTIHLLFGAGTNGTLGAVTFFVNHYTDIYKKNKSRPYIGVFEVDGNGAQVGEIEWFECNDYFR